MEKFSAIIIDKVGLHARPASALAKEASRYNSELKIFLNKDNGETSKQGNLKSLMNVMAMGVKGLSTITIEATGEDEKKAIEGIKNFMIENHLISN